MQRGAGVWRSATRLAASMGGKKVAYAVKRGRQTGIFPTWEEASKHVVGFPGAVYKGFGSVDDAKAFMGDTSTAVAGSAPPSAAGDAGGGQQLADGSTAGGSLAGSGSDVGVDGAQVMMFGKFKGVTFKQVAENNPDYVGWARKQKNPGGQLLDFLRWCDSEQHRGRAGEEATASSDSSSLPASRKRARDDGGVRGSAAAPGGGGIVFEMFFDGGSRGNGTNRAVAGSGAVIFRDRKKVWSAGRFLGQVTNNVAEYDGLILGLEGAAKLGIRELRVKGDSKLVVKQVQGLWKCNFAHLETLLNDARRRVSAMDKCVVEHVLRDGNADADAMANRAMDMRCDFEEQHTPAESERERREEEEDLIDPAERRAGTDIANRARMSLRDVRG